MDTVQYIALSVGAARASGINLYAAVFMPGYPGGTGNIDLPAEMMVVTDPLVMTAARLMYCVEFFADKTPGVDTAGDSIHTFIRIPLGAVLAMRATGDTTPTVELAAFLAEGNLTTATHATKARGRVIINASPEPVSNGFTSPGEDFLVIAGIWTALTHPLIFVIFIILMTWMLPGIWRGTKRIISTPGDFIKGNKKEPLPALNSSVKTYSE